MIKEISFTYPGIKEEQLSFKQAVVRMINSRRYLKSCGFEGRNDTYWGDYDQVNLSGDIEFPSGVKIDRRAFCAFDADRDSFLEKIISEECEFKRNNAYNRKKVIRTSFKSKSGGYQGYYFTLSVIDPLYVT